MAQTALKDQQAIFKQLIHRAQHTQFGRAHQFDTIRTHADYVQHVPILEYEIIKPYIQSIIDKGQDILWPGSPKYFAKTSGTTSGIKYIPISQDSIGYHIASARNATFNYCGTKNDASIFDGKMIFLSGSPTLQKQGNIHTGRLSGIVNHEIPSYIKKNQLPSYQTNCIETWEDKLQRIVEETASEDLRVISGIPPWVQMYFEQLLAHTGKTTVKDIFPNFTLFAHGGVNYQPYKATLEKLIGAPVDTLETYPASEGFFAFQDQLEQEDLLLNTNAGMYYEFVPLAEIHQDHPTRLTLDQVVTDQDYVLLVSSNAGLWAYNVGDTIRFMSTSPYRIRVSGRVKHFISAFGEHVIGKEVDEAIIAACATHHCSIVEYTVAPQVTPSDEPLPYHEWFIEFDQAPSDSMAFAKDVDDHMIRQNIYYADLITGKVLSPLKVRRLQPDSFRQYMKTQGKLGGQNKVPRLSNDRKIADQLVPYIL